jgi:hypothetical protein
MFYGIPLREGIGVRECLVLFVMLELSQASELTNQIELPLAEFMSVTPPFDGFDEWLYGLMLRVALIPTDYFDTCPGLKIAQYELMEKLVSISGIPEATGRLWKRFEVEEMLRLPIPFLRLCALAHRDIDRFANMVDRAIESDVLLARIDLSELSASIRFGRAGASWRGMG